MTPAEAYRLMDDSIEAFRKKLDQLRAEADCRRRRVGAVLLRWDGEVIGMGHNALPDGSCLAGACPRGRLSYDEHPAFLGYAETGCTAVHAEDRALRNARAAGHPTKGALLLVTAPPCPGCERKLRAAGVVRWLVVDPHSNAPEAPAAGQDDLAAGSPTA